MGQSNSSFKLKTFAQWIANAFYHSIILYVWAELFWYGDLIQGDGKIAGHWVWGTALYGAVLLTVLGKAALVTSNWTKYHVLAIPGSMAIWYIFIVAYGSVAPKVNFSMEYHGVVPRLYTSPVFWLQTVVLAFMCLLRDFVWKYAKRMYLSKPYHHIQELQKYNIQDYRPRYVPSYFAKKASQREMHSKFTMVKYSTLTCLSEWSNFRKQFGKSDKCSECESSVATLSRRPTKARHVCFKHTTRRNTEVVTERWRAQEHQLDNTHTRTHALKQEMSCYLLWDDVIFFSFSFLNRGQLYSFRFIF